MCYMQPGDVDVLRPNLRPVVALSVDELVFGASGFVVLAVYAATAPAWMLQISAAMMASNVCKAQDLRFAEMDVSDNDLDTRLQAAQSKAEPPYVCLIGPGAEGAQNILSVHGGELDSSAVLDWLHAQLQQQESEATSPAVGFDLCLAKKELQSILEEENRELSKQNMEAFGQMFDRIANVAQPSLESVLLLLQAQDSDEAGELMALLSKTDQTEMSATMSREPWMHFWEAIIELQGPFTSEEMASLQTILLADVDRS